MPGRRKFTSPTIVMPAINPTKAPVPRARGIIASMNTPRIEP